MIRGSKVAAIGQAGEDLVKIANLMITLDRGAAGKIVNQAIPDGIYKGERLDQAKCEKMLDEYYQLRGWDIKTGIPTKEKLLEDGLEDVVEDLEKRGKL